MSLIPYLGCDTCWKEGFYAILAGSFDFDPHPNMSMIPITSITRSTKTIDRINYGLIAVMCEQCSANHYTHENRFYKLHYLFPFNDPNIYIVKPIIVQNNDPTPEILTLET